MQTFINNPSKLGIEALGKPKKSRPELLEGKSQRSLRTVSLTPKKKSPRKSRGLEEG